jgi:hypothetical protein
MGPPVLISESWYYGFNPSVELAPIVDEVLKQTQEKWGELTDALSQNGWESLA